MMKRQFFKNQTGAWPVDSIIGIDARELNQLTVRIQIRTGEWIECKDLDALETLMLTKPSLLEGVPSIKWKKHMWLVHNFIGHPLMHLLFLLRLGKWGIWIHDATVPGITSLKLKTQSKPTRTEEEDETSLV